MEDLKQVFDLFGISIELFASISALVWVLVEALKAKIGPMKGWLTDGMAVLIAFLISTKMLYPNWESVAVATVLCWLAPAGVHKFLKTRNPNGGN